MNCILNDTIKDCRSKRFHSFEEKCVYDIKFGNHEEIVLSITLGYMEIKSLLYGLSKKFKNARTNGFIKMIT